MILRNGFFKEEEGEEGEEEEGEEGEGEREGLEKEKKFTRL